MTRATLKERQRQVREDTILESAHDLMTRNGVQAMTMDDVANDVGISKATLYQHFKSKEELVVGVINQKIQEFVKDIQTMDPALPTLVKLRQTVAWVIAKRFGENGLRMLDADATFRSDATILAYLQMHPEHRRHEKILTDVLSGLLDTAKAEGYISPRFSTRFMAQMLLSCLCDASYEIMLREGQCTLEDMTGTLIGMLCCSVSGEDLDAAPAAPDTDVPAQGVA
jgi:AcrR family transcriptional regulator